MYIVNDTTKILESGQIRKKAALTIPFCVCHFFMEKREDMYGRKIYARSIKTSENCVFKW